MWKKVSIVVVIVIVAGIGVALVAVKINLAQGPAGKAGFFDLRMGTPGVTYGDANKMLSIPLPAGDRGDYAIYTFDSPDEHDFLVSAENPSSYTVYKASAGDLVERGFWHGRDLVIDPKIQFERMFSARSKKRGNWSGEGEYWVVASSGSPSKKIWPSGYARSARPSPLPADGQSTIVPGGEKLVAGNDAIWLFFRIDNQKTLGFLIVLSSATKEAN